MGKQWKTVSDFIFGGSKITADGDCSHEIKRRLLLGRKVMTNLDIVSALFSPPNPMGVREVGRGGDRTPGPVERSSTDVSEGTFFIVYHV